MEKLFWMAFSSIYQQIIVVNCMTQHVTNKYDLWSFHSLPCKNIAIATQLAHHFFILDWCQSSARCTPHCQLTFLVFFFRRFPWKLYLSLSSQLQRLNRRNRNELSLDEVHHHCNRHAYIAAKWQKRMPHFIKEKKHDKKIETEMKWIKNSNK